VLVTAKGSKVLTDRVPKDVREVEAVCSPQGVG